MKRLLITWVCFSIISLLTQQSEPLRAMSQIKEWLLHTNHGNVFIELSRNDSVNGGAFSVLLLKPEGESAPTVAEESALLSQILKEMVSQGYDLRSLTYIVTSLRKSEYRNGVVDAVFKSGIWKSCEKQKYCHEAEPIANKYLLSINAFNEFDAAISEYGLKMKSVKVEDMTLKEQDNRITCGGLMRIYLERK